jgi:hypothetical protein
MPKTQTFPSQIVSGATFTLIAPVTGRVRNNVELALAPAYTRQRTARYDYLIFPQLPENKGIDIAKMSREDRAEAARLEIEFVSSNHDITMGWGRELFVSAVFDGETLDSFDKLLDEAPDTFLDEILKKTESLSGLSSDESGNSQPPSTSRAPEGGETSDTTAIIASATSTT